MAATGAWNEGRWGANTWGIGGLDVSVTVSGVQGNGLLDSVGTAGDAFVTPAGEQAVIAIGLELVTGQAPNVVTTGVQGNGQVGAVRTSISTFTTGVQALGQTGTLDVENEAFVFPTGTEGNGVLGVESVSAEVLVFAIGVEGDGFIGAEDVDQNTNVFVTGVVATGIAEGEVAACNRCGERAHVVAPVERDCAVAAYDFEVGGRDHAGSLGQCAR